MGVNKDGILICDFNTYDGGCRNYANWARLVTGTSVLICDFHKSVGDIYLGEPPIVDGAWQENETLPGAVVRR
jgi:hypothetical protein